MNMFEANSLVIQTNHARNWSREEREMNGYLAREWRFRPGSQRSARVFCTGGRYPKSEPRSKPVITPEREPHAWHMPNLLTSVYAILHPKRP